MEAGRRALDISLRALDAYKKTLLVDKVTSDDETSAPGYILDEISSILMSCSLQLTKEIVEYTLRRLRHRSPQVKKKALRFIKYSVNKAGSSAYRRELQSCAIAIRELVNYEGQVDPLKGNALNQAVRDAAQEAIEAIFSSGVSAKGKNIRIEGFGSGSFAKVLTTPYRSSSCGEMESESFYDRNGNGSFDYCNKNGSFDSMHSQQEDMEREGFHHGNGADSFDSPDCKLDRKGATRTRELPMQSQGTKFCTQKSEKVVLPEERLVNNVTAPIGSRLQPTEESLKRFLSSAKMLDALKIGGALKAKLQSPSWQVRLKAVCVLKAILLQKDANLLQAIDVEKGDFHGSVQECLNSPQTTLRREAKQAVDLLLALNEKVHEEASNILDNDPSCDKPFFTTEADEEARTCAGSLKAPPAVRSQHEVVDLLSFQENLTCDGGADTSSNSVMGDPFDGMCIYGSNAAAAAHVEDLLSDGWVSTHTDAPLKDWPNVQNGTLSTISLQSPALQPRQYKTDVLGFNSLFDFASNMSNATGQCAASSLRSKTSQVLSNENMPGLLNLDALYMHSNGAMGGSLHTNTWL